MGHIRPHRQFPWTALLALGIGASLYLLTREHASVYLLTLLPPSFHLGEPLPCRACDALPSFLHVYAFILISAYVLQPVNRRELLFLCLLWSGIEMLFEIGQIDSVASLFHAHLPAWIQKVPLLSVLDDYWLLGTFDPLDLLFTVLGALAAFELLVRRLAPEVQHDQTEQEFHRSSV